MSNGSDAIRFEQVPTVAIVQSFTPPITPAVPGNPGNNQYLQSSGSGVVSWAAKPTVPAIPSGTGWVKQSPLRFSVELESTGAPAFQLRPSIESAARAELAYTEYKPAGSVRAVVPDRVAVSPGSVRVLQLVFPMSGPYKGRVSNFDW